MKISKLAPLFALFALFAFVGVARADITAAQLAGKWKGKISMQSPDGKGIEQDVEASFTADGKCSFTHSMQGKATTREGNYAIDKDGILVKHMGDHGNDEIRLSGITLTKTDFSGDAVPPNAPKGI